MPSAFVWASGAVLVVMLLSGVLPGEKARLPLAAVAVAGTLVVFGLGYRTGEAGGRLVYQHGAAQAYVTAGAGGGAEASAGLGLPAEGRDEHEGGDDD